jgi:hypothetical protein
MTTTPLTTVLASAHDVLTRAEGTSRVPPRTLARFAKKVRLAERAVHAAQSGGATDAGLRTVVARAEAAAAKRTPSPEQARALEELRARIAGVDPGATDVSKLTESLRADTKALEEELAKGEAKAEPAKLAKTKPKKAQARKSAKKRAK